MKLKKAVLISQGGKSSEMIAEELNKWFEIVENIRLKEIKVSFDHEKGVIMANNNVVKDCDMVYLRGSYKNKELLSTIASIVQKETYTPISPEAFIFIHNKILTHLILKKEGIPMPTTYLVDDKDSAKELLKELNYPVILKFPEGTQGKGVVFMESYAAASSFIDALEKNKEF